MNTALLFGATGLVGKQVLAQLTANEYYDKIVVFNRKTQHYSSPKVEEIISDLKDLELIKEKIKGEVVFICVGTTIKKAGTKANFEAVDLELPISIAMAAKENNVSCLVAISSLGANVHSSNFYLKTKGDTEQSLSEIGVKHTYFVRPSMLFGKREEFRLAEYLGKIALKAFGLFLFGSLKKYKGIEDWQVAKAMILMAKNKPKQNVFESDELINIIN
ncbi:MAG: NAD(P)H-binding protein [Bacteroidetes bacterium]|nr:NAD-dependent epimerase/dehydratase family protein [Bacteroidota bacterium]NOG58200.1 NAD(P)H-binding protein [Bacteroidota bacterium]